jgi:hypothetical protein
MGLKIYRDRIGAEKVHADRIMRVSLNFNSFININEGDVLALTQTFGKPLDTVTKADVLAIMPSMKDDEAIATTEHLAVLGKLITVVKPVRDELPANDI